MKRDREADSVHSDLKNILDEFRKSSREDLANLQHVANEAEKHKVKSSLAEISHLKQLIKLYLNRLIRSF